MTKLRYGPASEKIQNSRGPCLDNPVSMYHTSYISSFNHSRPHKKSVNNPSKIQVINRPTGYNANFRPCIYYTPNLDDLDNPKMKLKVEEHYMTNNEKDFKPLQSSPTGQEMGLKQDNILPYYASGFTTMRNRAHIQKTSKEIENSYKVIERLNQSLNGKAVNTQRNTKDPIANENNFTGPDPMSTESTAKYTGHQGRWPTITWRHNKSIGHKEPTANTRIEPYDPIEYNTRNPYRHDDISSNYHNRYNRPIGNSEQQINFIQHEFHSNKNVIKNANNYSGIPQPTPKSERNTGYSLETTIPRYTDKSVSFNQQTVDDSNYLSITRSDPYKCTLARYSFSAPGIRRCDTQVDDRIGKRHLGNKEATGYVKNHPSYNQTHEMNRSRFETHYARVFEKTCVPASNARDNSTLSLSLTGWPINNKANNGFTKSTKVHSH